MAHVEIQLIDQNDNSPIFYNVKDVIEVNEDAPVGYLVANVTAYDLDAGLNGEVYYFIGARISHLPFHIDSATGALTVSRVLDREETGRYRFDVSASDRGQPNRRVTQVSIQSGW